MTEKYLSFAHTISPTVQQAKQTTCQDRISSTPRPRLQNETHGLRFDCPRDSLMRRSITPRIRVTRNADTFLLSLFHRRFNSHNRYTRYLHQTFAIIDPQALSSRYCFPILTSKSVKQLCDSRHSLQTEHSNTVTHSVSRTLSFALTTSHYAQSLIEIQAAYINTNHPAFTSGSAAPAQAATPPAPAP